MSIGGKRILIIGGSSGMCLATGMLLDIDGGARTPL